MKVLYKILHSVILLTLVPVLLFLPMFRFIMVMDVSSSSSLGVLGSILGSALDVNKIVSNAIGYDLSKLPENWTLKGVYDFFLGPNAKIDVSGFGGNIFPDTITKPMTAAGILFAVAVALAVVALIVGVFVKRKWIPAIFSGAALVSTFAANKLFTNAAQLLVSGRVSVRSILENVEALEQYKSYLEYLKVDIRMFQLGSAYTMMLLALAVAVIFCIVMHVVEKTS